MIAAYSFLSGYSARSRWISLNTKFDCTGEPPGLLTRSSTASAFSASKASRSPRLIRSALASESAMITPFRSTTATWGSATAMASPERLPVIMNSNANR